MIISILLQIIISCCFIYVYDKYAYTKTIDCKLKKLHINNFLKIAIICISSIPIAGAAVLLLFTIKIEDIDHMDDSWKQNKILYWLFK